MKAGDMVRFEAPHWLGGAGFQEAERPRLIGLLVEYHTWEKMATIIYEGKIVRVQARVVEKAGKKDFGHE
jgi:hypothetical protein